MRAKVETASRRCMNAWFVRIRIIRLLPRSGIGDGLGLTYIVNLNSSPDSF